MRIVYAGTPPFAAAILGTLLAAKHEVVLVLTQPDRPSGRGMKLTPSAVKTLAQSHALALAQPETLKTVQAQQTLRDSRPDVMIVAAYGLILPQAVLDIPKYGAINVHASLLPRWRGAAPIQRAILAGDQTTGVTIMQLDAGLDTGYMLLTRSMSITQNDTAGTVEAALTHLGAEALLATLTLLEHGELCPRPQPSAGATYASKIRKEEARLDFSLDAVELDRVVRAFNPIPIAFTSFRGEPLRVWQAEPDLSTQSCAPVGSLFVRPNGTVAVTCGAGALVLSVVQRPGGKPIAAGLWAANVQPKADERLGF